MYATILYDVGDLVTALLSLPQRWLLAGLPFSSHPYGVNCGVPSSAGARPGARPVALNRSRGPAPAYRLRAYRTRTLNVPSGRARRFTWVCGSLSCSPPYSPTPLNSPRSDDGRLANYGRQVSQSTRRVPRTGIRCRRSGVRLRTRRVVRVVQGVRWTFRLS